MSTKKDAAAKKKRQQARKPISGFGAFPSRPFKKKAKVKLADGGLVSKVKDKIKGFFKKDEGDTILGGASGKAEKTLRNRGRQIDAAVDQASGVSAQSGAEDEKEEDRPRYKDGGKVKGKGC